MRASSRFARKAEGLAGLARRPPRQKRLALEAAINLLAIKAMLTLLPSKKWLAGPVRAAGPACEPLPEQQVAEVVWAVDRVSRRFPGFFTCLPRAAAVQRMLSARGAAATLAIGVARDAGDRFEAHAWVEHRGQVIIGRIPDLDRYHQLPAWPRKGELRSSKRTP